MIFDLNLNMKTLNILILNIIICISSLSAQEIVGLNIGNTAPELEFSDPNGDSIKLSSLKGNIVLIDEIHTPDSSRYFYKEGYLERQLNGEPQKQLSKEFVRQWLISNNFQILFHPFYSQWLALKMPAVFRVQVHLLAGHCQD